MIGYGSKDKTFCIGYLPPLRKPCLVIKDGNSIIKVASFNNAESARTFMDFFADLFILPKIDWTGDDIPVGLMTKEERDKVFEEVMKR